MDEFLAQVADPVRGSELLGHIDIHSCYDRQRNAIRYGVNSMYAKWGYRAEERASTFRPQLFGIVTDLKTCRKDLGYGVNEYPTIILGYPNVQHDMVSGNFYSQLVSLREQMYKDVEESDVVSSTIFPWTPLESDTIEVHVLNNAVVEGDTLVEEANREPFTLTSTLISRGWYPGLIEKGAFVVAEVELQRIDHLTSQPLTMYYNVIAHKVVVHAHKINISVGVKHDM
ncbi:hypothetical protein F5876DRAFT_69187 [Lentinula aff. lateritia]|uniref:Uncharacterized protein n=1 Tax=Lentinula aff. lateritia TaxID=2804960 RepID=A0ACC1TNU8_9AGAR|nr:hypothetical protein F5876DRAFT_69187 [Lentinula aff. lateritia]